QGDDRFLDAAGVFETQDLTSRDARGVRVDVAADAEQLASDLQATSGITFEALSELGTGIDVGDAHRLGVDVALDPELRPIFQLHLERQSEVATLPGAPAVGALHPRC